LTVAMLFKSTFQTFLSLFAKLRKATLRLVMSVCPSVCLSAWNNSASTVRIFRVFDICVFFRECVEKIQFSLKSDKKSGYFTCRPTYIYDNILVNYSENKKIFEVEI
jgi:hypothetical protein